MVSKFKHKNFTQCFDISDILSYYSDSDRKKKIVELLEIYPLRSQKIIKHLSELGFEYVLPYKVGDKVWLSDDVSVWSIIQITDKEVKLEKTEYCEDRERYVTETILWENTYDIVPLNGKELQHIDTAINPKFYRENFK